MYCSMCWLEGCLRVNWVKFSGLSCKIQRPKPFLSGDTSDKGSKGLACKLFVAESFL